MQMAHQDIQSGLLAKQGRQFAGGRLSATVGNAAVIWTFIGSLPALSGCTTDEPAADGKTAKKRITTVDYWMGGTRFVFPAELGQDGGGSPQHKPNRYRGLHGTPDLNELSRTLIAFAMQMYYEDTANASNPNKQLFTDVTGGIRFDMADGAHKFRIAFQNNQTLDFNDAKGFAQYFNNYLKQATFSDAERSQINTALPRMGDWYVQAGGASITATDTLNRRRGQRHAVWPGWRRRSNWRGGNQHAGGWRRQRHAFRGCGRQQVVG